MLKEKPKWKLLVKKLKLLELRLKLELLPRKPREKEEQKSIALKWRRKLKLGGLNRRESGLKLSKNFKLNVLNVRQDSRSTD